MNKKKSSGTGALVSTLYLNTNLNNNQHQPIANYQEIPSQQFSPSPASLITSSSYQNNNPISRNRYSSVAHSNTVPNIDEHQINFNKSNANPAYSSLNQTKNSSKYSNPTLTSSVTSPNISSNLSNLTAPNNNVKLKKTHSLLQTNLRSPGSSNLSSSNQATNVILPNQVQTPSLLQQTQPVISSSNQKLNLGSSSIRKKSSSNSNSGSNQNLNQLSSQITAPVIQAKPSHSRTRNRSKSSQLRNISGNNLSNSPILSANPANSASNTSIASPAKVAQSSAVSSTNNGVSLKKTLQNIELKMRIISSPNIRIADLFKCFLKNVPKITETIEVISKILLNF